MSGFIGTKLTMNLGERSYDIILKNGALEMCIRDSLDSRALTPTPVPTPTAIITFCRENASETAVWALSLTWDTKIESTTL